MPAQASTKNSADSRAKAEAAKKSLKGRLISKLNYFQQRHKWLGFSYAMQKKYSEDEVGYQAALVTYYGFLSLFPLLIVAMTLTQLSLFSNANLKAKIISSLNRNFPIVGSQLQNNVHATQKAGIALVISIILTLYGARGVAQAFQTAMDHIWQIPKYKRGGFLNNIKSILLVLLMGIGFIVSGALSSYLTAGKINIGLRIVATVLSLALLVIVISLVFKLSLSVKRKFRDFITGSIIAAVGFQIIQIAGGFLITHELKKTSSLYGTFAVIFAILFWIYLLGRLILYATELDSVRILKLWPRSLVDYDLTAADQRALKLHAGRERYIAPPEEEMDIRFN